MACDLDFLTLKVVSESRVTWVTSVTILVFLGLSVLDLGPMYTTDRQTSDVHQRLKVHKGKVKVHTLDIAPLRSETTAEALRYGACSHGISQFYLHTHTFIYNRNEPYLPLPSQPQLVLIYRPRRDGRLSRPWCEVTQAEIRTHNLPIANPALYHTAPSAG